jgi:PIN domain nuclease of toxin-antitoxin system
VVLVVVLLLDTHVWVWSMAGDSRRIGRGTRQLLIRAQARDAIRVSPVTLFEVAALHTLGRIRFSLTVDHWIHRSLDAPGVRTAEMTPSVALDAGLIPRAALPDPLDRLLVATARQLAATFVTADEAVLEYAETTGQVRVRDARI